MVVANTSSGVTHTVDLREQASLRDLHYLLQSDSITALAILHDGQQVVLPPPKKFRHKPAFGVELVANGNTPIAERIYSHVGEVRISLTRTFKSKLIRCDLSRIGVQRYKPV